MAEQWRLFIALPLTATVRERVRAAQTAAREVGFDARWVVPDQAHLTLKFLGDTDPALVGRLTARLRAIASAHGQFVISTGRLGAFPDGQRPRIVWLGLAGDLAHLGTLRDAIETDLAPLGFPRETRSFRPHLTLGRLREVSASPPHGAMAAAQAILGERTVSFPITEFLLIHSELGRGGPRYTTLGTFPLAAPDVSR